MEKSPTENKSLLIIKAHPQSLGPAEMFLKNRQWKVKSTSNLKEALIYLVQEHPQFVMVSIDHPNKKVRKLPKVLIQAFPVCVIAFAESSTTSSIKILNDLKAEYTIFPPVMGPAIERMVNKYYKDQQNQGITPSSRNDKWADGGIEKAMIAIKGEGAAGENSAHNFLAQLLSSEGDLNSTSTMGNSPELSTATSSQITPDLSGVITTNSSSEMSATSSSEHRNSENLNKESTTPPRSNFLSNGAKPDLHSAQQDSNSAQEYYMQPTSEAEESDTSPLSPRPQKNHGGGWVPLPTKKKPRAPGSDPEQDKLPGTGQDSLISQGARDALEKSCEATGKNLKISNQLTTTSQVACIFIESPRFSGYLIAAMAKNTIKLDIPFIERIRGRLFRFLKDRGESIEENESVAIKIREVPFEDWALEHADFLRKSVHLGEEVAMAYFPRQNLTAQVTDSTDEEMAAISIEELVADVPVEFNVYLFLPRNNKYVLYTPCGGVFFSNQKERLVSQGIKQLHVLRIELSILDKYRAQNFLNEKINEFINKEQERASA